MTLEQLRAFSVADDHARQEQVWELLAHSYNKSASYIRQKLTEDTVRVADKRVRFVTVDAYIASGCGVMRADRKSGVKGKSVSVRVDLGGRRIIKKKKKSQTKPIHIQKNRLVKTQI